MSDFSSSNSLVDIYKVLEFVDNEEEFEGEIPDGIWELASSNKEHMALCLRVAVRLTKQNIREKILTLL